MNMVNLCLRYSFVRFFLHLEMKTLVLQGNQNDSRSVQECADVIAFIS